MNNIEEILEKVATELITFDTVDSNILRKKYSTVDNLEKIGIFERDFGMEQWDWPQGVAIFGLKRFSNKYDDYIIKWAKKEISKGLPQKNVNTICPLLTLMDFKEFEELSLDWMNWIESSFPFTFEDGLQHITSGEDKNSLKMNEQQIWADTIFMTVLFIGKMGKKYNNTKWIEIAKYQLLLHLKYLGDRETGLFYHAWDFKNNSNFGANFWCRGNCWMTIGIPLFLEILGEDLSISEKKFINNYYKNQVNKLLELKIDGSLWHTILNDKASYIETSGSAGIVTGILIGYKSGLLSLRKEKIEKLIVDLIEKVDDSGVVVGVSAGTPVSNSKEDYKNIIQIPMVYGQALMLTALAEYLNIEGE